MTTKEKQIAKEKLIEQLAHFLVDDVGGKSIMLQMESTRPAGDPRPKLATEWVAVCRAAKIEGYASYTEAIKTLTEILK